MVDIDRIQAQLRAAVRLSHEVVTAPPFTCFFNPDSDAAYANIAIPDEAASDAFDAGLAAVEREFRARGRRPSLEYLEPYAPLLAACLEARGYECEVRSLLMVCTPEMLVAPRMPAGFTVEAINDATPLETIQDLMTVQARAFGDEASPRTTAEDAAQFRRRFAALRLFAGRLDGVIVSAASLTAPYEGVAEVAGVATAPGFRRHGFAGALTYAATAAAFDQGVSQAFLTAANEAAGRVYAKVGYHATGSGLAYRLE